MPATPDNSALPFAIVDEGVVLHVIASPKSSRDEVSGVELIDGSGGDVAVFRARVRALPDKGQANKAILQLFAKWLGVPKSSVTLRSGSKARHKVLLVKGCGVGLAKQVAELMERNFDLGS